MIGSTGQHIKTVILVFLRPLLIAGHKTQSLAVFTSGPDDTRKRIQVPWVVKFAGDAEEIRQSKCPDPQHIDPVHCSNLFNSIEPMFRFDLGDYQVLGVRILDLGERRSWLVIIMGKSKRGATPTNRRIACCRNNCLGSAQRSPPSESSHL